MVYSNAEAIQMIQILGQCQNNYSAAARLWRQRFPEKTPHTGNVFSRLLRRAHNEGILQPHHNKGRKIRRYVRDEKSADIIASAIVAPNDSLRRRERDSGVSIATQHRIFRASKFHPYRAELHQALNQNDFEQRRNFCNWARQQPPNFHRSILFSDECTFKSDYEVSNWNFRYWSDVNPHWLREVDKQHIWKVNVWCGIIGDQVVGPIFFNNNLNAARYLQLLQTDLIPHLEDLPLDLRQRMWFHQDGCPAHTSHIIRNHLNETFPDKWIGKWGPVNYPPRSPDLTVLDYYLWGRIKQIVYQTRPTTKADMEQRITQAIQNLTSEEILRATDAFKKRVRICIREHGTHIEHLI